MVRDGSLILRALEGERLCGDCTHGPVYAFSAGPSVRKPHNPPILHREQRAANVVLRLLVPVPCGHPLLSVEVLLTKDFPKHFSADVLVAPSHISIEKKKTLGSQTPSNCFPAVSNHGTMPHGFPKKNHHSPPSALLRRSGALEGCVGTRLLVSTQRLHQRSLQPKHASSPEIPRR